MTAVLAIAIIFGSMFIYYLSTTMSPQKCIEYSQKHSLRKATKFSRIGDGRYLEDYAYFIAIDGDSSKGQEIFVFKRKFFGPIQLDRYKFIMSTAESVGDADFTNKIGALKFFTRNNYGEKETEASLIFFGSIRDADIASYEYTLTVREGSNVYKGVIGAKTDFWFLKFYGLNNIDENFKKIVSDVRFYDSDGNLIGVYSPNENDSDINN